MQLLKLKRNVPLLCLIFLISCNNSEKKKTQIQIGQNSEVNQTSLEVSIEKGNEVYQNFCLQCHLPNGKGIPNNFPPLAGSDWLTEKREESIRAVKFGQNGEIKVNGLTYNGVMTPMGLSDEEIANVMNYVMNSWGNTQDKMVTEAEVTAVEK
ncbi:c-type cytochrome [Ulvibacter antarcticus]|uniref:Cytochrome c n=1 Tax=Ulvibacter antarcticus TaxID=442714 RepID=A0A3L9Z3F5_9FLAO|nr:cytochrome c [Ulvibacter antarcticus]RMA64835.1 cytochrome c [Ulvibacter antarcticus]